MPRSKRQQLVSLSKTDKKSRDDKSELMTRIRDCFDSYSHVYLFSVDNMRNTYLKDVRADWPTSRFFFGKNKVMAKALGTTAEDEHRDNLHLLAEKLSGKVGLLFTDSLPAAVSEYFRAFRKQDYPRSGFVANQTVALEEGPVMRGEEKMPHNMEPSLRKLGLPTRLDNGVVTLTRDCVICKEGQTLTPEQCQLLKHFYYQMAEFAVTIVAVWTNGEYQELDQPLEE